MQNQVVAIALVLAIVVGAGAGYLEGATAFVHTTESRTTTLTTTSTITMFSISTSSTTSVVTKTDTVLRGSAGPYATMITKDSLRMELTLNTSSVPLGGAIQIQMNLTNMLNSHSVVPMGSAWPMDGLGWLPNPCFSYYYPVGLAVFAGYYVAGNMSTGRPLFLMKPGTIFCPAALSFSSYSFEPASNVAILNSVPPSTIRVHALTIANGSWSGGSPPDFAGSKFSHFSSGVYTVIEGDEWGDVLFLYFRVGS